MVGAKRFTVILDLKSILFSHKTQQPRSGQVPEQQLYEHHSAKLNHTDTPKCSINTKTAKQPARDEESKEIKYIAVERITKMKINETTKEDRSALKSVGPGSYLVKICLQQDLLSKL